MSASWASRSHELEVVTAQRDHVLDRLADLERIITTSGGYMTPDDQAALFAARAALAEHGRRTGGSR